MKLENIKERIAKVLAGDSEELGRLARDLGHELPRKRLEILSEFRATLAGSIPPEGRYIRNCIQDDGRVRGYLQALADVAAAFSAATAQPAEAEKEKEGQP